MNGVLPVDKPVGPSSHDIVAVARRALGIHRIGHTGTLDPFASGLMVLCVGPATRLSEFLTGLDKTYEATARLGMTTDTLDRTGQVVALDDGWSRLDVRAIRAAFEDQAGPRLQRPPAFSAKKVAGRRAYDVARAGGTPDLAPVEVEIYELEVLSVEGPEVTFRIRCSSGTYVRSVAADAGTALGVGAHLVRLRRTAVGALGVDRALPMESLEDSAAVRDALIQPLAAVEHLPAVTVTAEDAVRIRHGQSIPGGEGRQGTVVLAVDGRLLAVAESDGAWLRPRKVLA
jgi:tRNA pseudouridine55 synthase